MTDTSKLVSIGEFSGATRISVRMLRHYDQNYDTDPSTTKREDTVTRVHVPVR